MADPSKLKKLQEVGRPEILFSIARVPGTETVFVGASDGHLYRMDLTAEKVEPQAIPGHQSYVTGVAYFQGRIVSCGFDKKVIWRDAETGMISRELESAHGKWIRGMAQSADGSKLATVGDDMVCRVWDALTGDLIQELAGHDQQTPHHYPSMLYAAAFSPDGKHLATADRVGRIVVWDFAAGTIAAELEAPEMYTWDPRARRHSIGGIRSLAFSPDGDQLAVGGMGKVGNIDHLEGKARVELFDWKSGELVHQFDSLDYKGLVEDLAYGPGGKWLLAVGGDHSGFLMFLDLESKKSIKDEKFGQHIHGVTHNEDFSRFAVASHGRVGYFSMTED